MRYLTVRLFGGLELRYGTDTPLAFPTRKARSIFAFLALHRGRLFPRDFLCGTFWEESTEEVAKKGLRTELWRIRQVFDAIPVDPHTFLYCDAAQVGVMRAPVLWVDVQEFEECVRHLHLPGEADSDARYREDLERALELYRGDLLDGIYDRWCGAERGRFHLEFLTVLEGLMTYHQRRGEWMWAIARGAELLREDGLREHVHRELMQCHYAMGNRPAAIRQYRSCVRILREELDIEPMPETRALFDLIREGRPLPLAPLWPTARPAGSAAAPRSLRSPFRPPDTAAASHRSAG